MLFLRLPSALGLLNLPLRVPSPAASRGSVRPVGVNGTRHWLEPGGRTPQALLCSTSTPRAGALQLSPSCRFGDSH